MTSRTFTNTSARTHFMYKFNILGSVWYKTFLPKGFLLTILDNVTYVCCYAFNDLILIVVSVYIQMYAKLHLQCINMRSPIRVQIVFLSLKVVLLFHDINLSESISLSHLVLLNIKYVFFSVRGQVSHFYLNLLSSSAKKWWKILIRIMNFKDYLILPNFY